MRDGLRGALIGAAFLMATSAIGPGFLTQTAVFTEKRSTSRLCANGYRARSETNASGTPAAGTGSR